MATPLFDEATSPPRPIQKKQLINHIVDGLANSRPETLFAEYPISATSYELGFRKVTYGNLANAINGLAWWLHRMFGPGKDFETLTYIGPNDIRYNALVLAAVKAGYKVLLSSPRNSIPAHVNLFNRLGCRILITPKPHPPHITEILNNCKVRVADIPSVEELLDQNYEHYPYHKTFVDARNEPLVVLHTSGTTGLPKPIVFTHDVAASWHQALTMEPPVGYENQFLPVMGNRLFLALPPFHSGGIYSGLFNTVFTQAIGIWPLAGALPSAQGVVDALKHTKADVAFLPPMFMDEIAKNPHILDFLAANLSSLAYGGGDISRLSGDKISKRMKFFMIYGSTETGIQPAIRRARQWAEDEWRWLRPNPGAHFEFRHYSEDVYEAVVMRESDPENLQQVFKLFPNLNEYATGDLFSRHPSEVDLWTYNGRSDDIIVFLSGEKTNPTSMEWHISSHPEVRSALVFGDLRFQAGLLIEPTTDEPLSTMQRAELIERLWAIIEEANEECPRHAKIDKSHILFTEPRKPLQRAGKGTVQRRLSLKVYANEIEALYADAEKTTLSALGPVERPQYVISMTDDSVSSFIHETIMKLTSWPSFGNEEDIFVRGMDSLQALQLTRTIKSGLAIPDFEISTVYTNPSVASLTNACLQLSIHQEASKQSKELSRRQTIISTLEEFKCLIREISPKPVLTSNGVSQRDRVFILTGSTGALGSYILQHLLKNPTIRHIYCLNRASDSRSLQLGRSKARSLPAEFPDSRVTFLTASWHRPSLGLEPEMLTKLTNTVTDTIHNAWPVNFNLSLESFRPHLSGIVNLLSLSASSSHTTNFFYISSVSSVMGSAPDSVISETIVEDVSAPSPIGYAESKFLAENILSYAATLLPSVNVGIARLGQVAGPARMPGSWNRWEWIPSLVISSFHLGAIPESLGSASKIDWVPIDIVAEAVAELVLGMGHGESNLGADMGGKARVFHPLNPTPTTWSALLPVVVSALDKMKSPEEMNKRIEIVSLNAWIRKLRVETEKVTKQDVLKEELDKNPAIKLLSFYESLQERTKLPAMEVKNAVEGSETLRDLEGIEGEWMEKWVKDWIA